MTSQIDPTIPKAGQAKTAALRGQMAIIKGEIEALQAQLAALHAVASSGDYNDLLNTPVQPNLHPIATSGSYNDLINAPTLASVAQSGQYAHLIGSPALHPVATSGAYAALDGKPTLGTAAALDAGTGAGEVLQLNETAKLPAVDGSQLTNLSGGRLIDSKLHTYATYTATTSGKPLNNTRVQSNEGVVLTSAPPHTPASAANTIRVTANVPYTHSTGASSFFALFKDADPTSFAQQWVAAHHGHIYTVTVVDEFFAGAVAPIVVSIRFGNNGGGGAITYVNGYEGQPIGGGGVHVSVLIEEFSPAS